MSQTLDSFSKHKLLKHNNLTKSTIKKGLKYSFRFASIISPSSLSNTKMLLKSMSYKGIDPYDAKILIKQSYIVLTWFSYIQDRSLVNKVDTGDTQGSKLPSLFVHKSKRVRFTHTKAPMAHKTFSQEQFMSKYYFFSVSFKSDLLRDDLTKSVNSSLYLLLQLRRSFAPVDTNFLILQRLSLSFRVADSKFMKLS